METGKLCTGKWEKEEKKKSWVYGYKSHQENAHREKVCLGVGFISFCQPTRTDGKLNTRRVCCTVLGNNVLLAHTALQC